MAVTVRGGGGRCTEIKIRVDLWTVRWDEKRVAFVEKWPLEEVQLYYYNALFQKNETQVTTAVICLGDLPCNVTSVIFL